MPKKASYFLESMWTYSSLQIDLSQRLVIVSLRLFLRRNCCFESNYGLTVRIGDITARNNSRGNPLVGNIPDIWTQTSYMVISLSGKLILNS